MSRLPLHTCKQQAAPDPALRCQAGVGSGAAAATGNQQSERGMGVWQGLAQWRNVGGDVSPGQPGWKRREGCRSSAHSSFCSSASSRLNTSQFSPANACGKGEA